MVLDNAQIHKSPVVRRTVEGLGPWVRLLWLPAYCPDLNDIERIWKREKERTFANTLAGSFEEFGDRVRGRFRSLAHRGRRVASKRRRSAFLVARALRRLLGVA